MSAQLNFTKPHVLRNEAEYNAAVAVTFMMDQKGLTRADLAVWVGGKSRASEFLNGVRSLSMRQIQALRENLGIPADLLIPERS